VIKHGDGDILSIFLYNFKILNLLSGGLILSSGRQGRPHTRLLRCNDGVTRIYWCETKDLSATDRLDDKRSLHLREVIDVRRGIDPDPSTPGLTGTAVLRRNCTPENLKLSFSLILTTRTFDIQCMNDSEYNFLFGNFSAYCNRFKSRGGNRDYDEQSIISGGSAR
jgi:hypothetical protein